MELRMNDPIIVCPTCKTEIKLTESLALPLIESTRKEYDQKIQKIQADVSAREAEILKQRDELVKQREGLEDQVAQRLNTERERVSAEEARKARLLVFSDLDQKAKEVAELQKVLKERDIKLGEAQKAQAELIRKQRELDDAKREMELTIQKKVQESLNSVRDQARKDAEDELKLKVSEKEQTIIAMQRQIEELKRKAEQGSQQLQGEVQELELEAVLRARFQRDSIEPVPKGEHGGDVLQRVLGSTGQNCGTILWESKRTKNWSDTWLAKIRDDQRAAKAEIAVIVSKTVPREIEGFDLREGVWVVEPRYAVPIGVVLRQSLVELAATRKAAEGQETKMEMLYQYLTGPRFRQRVQAIVEKFGDMQEDLEKERRSMTRLWAKREEQIHGAIEATAGMYGDLQGIAGKSLHEVDGLELKALGAANPRDSGSSKGGKHGN
jgi:hypothetical protein